MAEGEVANITFGYTANDGIVDSAPATVTLTVTGTNDAPVVTGEHITKIADHDITPITVTVAGFSVGGLFPFHLFDSEHTELVTQDFNGYYGVDENKTNMFIFPEADAGANLVDGKGSYDEGISFTYSGLVSQAVISFNMMDSNDKVAIELYDGSKSVSGPVIYTGSISDGVMTIEGPVGVNFDKIVITAEINKTEFQVKPVSATAALIATTTYDTTHTDGLTVSAYYDHDVSNAATVTTNNSAWGVSSSFFDNDKIDGNGSVETIVFTFATAVESATVNLENWNHNDTADWKAYNAGGDLIASGSYTDNNPASFVVTAADIKSIEITAPDSNSEFKIDSITTTAAIVPTGVDTLHPFTIDASMLLANDTDVDSSMLHVVLGDGVLYDDSTVPNVIGSVTLDSQGNVLVTPDVGLDASVVDSAHFAYTVVDEYGASSASVDAIIDVKLGTVTDSGLTYTQTASDDFVIGSDGIDTLVIDDSGTFDLSHVSNIEVVELATNATIENISAADVISMTDSHNDLIIDGNNSNAVSVDSSSLTRDAAQNTTTHQAYSDGNGATLLIDIDVQITEI
jgi:hypothetical protein